MVELCLMASHGYPPGLGLGFHQEHTSSRASDEFNNFVPYHGIKQDLVDPLFFNLSGQQKEELRSPGAFLDSNHFFRFDSAWRRPASIDFQDTSLASAVLGFGIVERCAMHENILKLFMSGSIEQEEEDTLLNLSMLYDLTGPQSPIAESSQQPFVSQFRQCSDDGQTMQNFVYPTRELYFKEPLYDLGGDQAAGKVYHPDGHGPYGYNSTELADMLSVICDIHSLKNTNKSSRQTMLVPYFERRRKASAKADALKLGAEKVGSLKSNGKLKEKTSRKKKTTSLRTATDRDSYSNSNLHACESLLSVIMDRKQQGKNAIFSLKKSSPQLPRILTQFSASIAGTGIAVVLSVLCRVACNRVPFCASKLLSTGLGLGLVSLSWAVNRLRDTIVSISRNAGKVEKEQEMMNHLDRNLKDICFRAVALVAVVALKAA